MTKTLSITVPSYNVEHYLRSSLESYITAGEDERLEVLVVDDGSTDSTARIAQEFCNNHPGIFRLIRKRNGGHGSAVNAGLAQAQGKYFRVIDGDDRICSNNVSPLLDALDAAAEDLVADIKREIVLGTNQSRILELPSDLPLRCTLRFEDVCTRDDIEEFFMIHTVSARTDYLRAHAISLLEHAFYVDYEWIVKLSSHAQTIRFLDLEVCNYYIGNAEQSVAPANYVQRWEDHSRVTCELLAFARDAHLDPFHQIFVNKRVKLLVNTHYTIALIYDVDRIRGLRRAREFRTFLRQEHYPFFVAGEKRYRSASALHKLGVDAKRLDRLMGR